MNVIESVILLSKRIVWRLERKRSFNEVDYEKWCREYQENAKYLGDYTDILQLLIDHAEWDASVKKSKELLEKLVYYKKALIRHTANTDGNEEEES